MKHAIHIAGVRYRLRPIGRRDAGLIVALRGDLERTRFLHPIDLCIEAQEAYLEQYFTREGDYYFLIEGGDKEEAEGLIGL